MIEFEKVSYGYGDTTMIKDLSFIIKRGEFVAIIGENGAGKTTIAKLMRGLLRPIQGKVKIKNQDISNVKVSSLSAMLGYLFQNPDRQICKNTIKEEMLFSIECAGIEKSKREELLGNTLQRFGLDAGLDPFQLSRGERQRVALESVIVNKPEVLILDEPTTGLDYKECTQIMDHIKELNHMGVTVIMITHDMELVLDYATRVLAMTQGRVVADGTPQDIFYNLDAMKQALLLPPQIIELSLYMNQPFGRVYQVSEMEREIKRRVK